MNRYNRRNSLSNTFKDYFVPIVGLVLIIVIIYSFLSGDDASTTNTESTNENRNGYEVVFNDIDTEALIEYESGKKEQIESGIEIFKGEKLLVKEGNVALKTSTSNIKVAKLGELKLNSDGTYSLFSSDVWFSNNTSINVNMRYGSIKTSETSVISLSQNEVGSSVYVVSGTAEVSNLAGQSTLLGKGQKITIPRSDASKEDIDLSLLKSDFDNYFLRSDWFLENNGPALLQQTSEGDFTSNTGSLDSSTGMVSFSGLRDEMRTDSRDIEVTGIINNLSVVKITINNIEAAIDESTNSFIFESIPLNQSMNDLVVKIFDINGGILEKSVYTVYTSSIAENAATNSANTSSNIATSSSGGGATYEVDATQFGFTAPSATGKFSTVGSEITIRGITTAKGIARVEVNGFNLSSFNGSTWRYHAFTRFETLEEGTNQYKVDYFDESDNVVYTDYYTIVKKEAGAQPVQVATPSAVETDIPEAPVVETNETISDEANPQ